MVAAVASKVSSYTEGDYRRLLAHTPNGRHFDNRIGYKRRAGFAVPAFSLYSQESIGICDFDDLKRMVDFTNETGGSILQLLPMNCTDFAPYSAQSGFALNTAHLSLRNIKGINASSYQSDLRALKDRFPIELGSDGAHRVNYGVKKEKLELLWKMFNSRNWDSEGMFQEFKNKTAAYWLDDYVLYRVLKEKNNEKSWEDWPLGYKNGDESTLIAFKRANGEQLEFHRWLQWQAFEQASDLKKYAETKSVFLMGDIPFLPARDSADVYTDFIKKTGYFILKKQAGALPDMYFADGQLWGNPVPNWKAMERDNFRYIREKRRYASNFYHIERKDHEIGQSRLCINNIDAKHNKDGTFLPPGKIGDETSERRWQTHHRKILAAQINDLGSTMLYTSEGLGSPPKYMRETLEENGVPDIYVQRWTKQGPTFEQPRPIGVTTTSTHDCTLLPGWWGNEAGTIDAGMFQNMCAQAGMSASDLIPRLFEEPSNGRLRWRKGLTGDEAELRSIGGLQTEFDNTVDEEVRFLTYLNFRNISPDDEASAELVQRVLEVSSANDAMFNVPSLFDALATKKAGLELAKEHRINRPGIPDKWNLMTDCSLDEMSSDGELIDFLRTLHARTNRI